jgi:hypothetical protein
MDKADVLLEQWKVASELHRHMDKMAWQRFNYFIAINGLLLSTLGAIATSSAFNDKDPPLPLRVMTIAIPAFGTFVSLIWNLIQKRGQLYHHYMGIQARQIEEALRINGERVLNLYEKNLNEQELISVPKFKRYLKSRRGKWRTHSLIGSVALFLTVAWLLLLAFFLVYSLLQ